MDSVTTCFMVEKDDFSSALSWVARSLASKPTQPILRGIHITAGEEYVEFAGFDYEVSTKIRIPATVTEPGEFLVAGRILADIVSALPGKPISVKVSDSSVLLTCGSSHFTLPAMNVEDYPALPDLPQVTGRIQPGEFMNAISQVAVAAGSDDAMPMLTGIYMEVDGAKATLVATDRFRLAVRELTWEPEDSAIKAHVLVPAKTLADTSRTLDAHSQDPIVLAMGGSETVGSEGLLGILGNQRQTTTRLIDGDFPNYGPLLPKTHTTIAAVDVKALIEAIRRVSLVGDRNPQVKLDFSEGQVRLSSGQNEIGEAEETLPAEVWGEPLLIAFTARYLLDGLNAVKSDKVYFGFTMSTRPAIITPTPEVVPTQSEDGTFPALNTPFTYLIMPTRLPG